MSIKVNTNYSDNLIKDFFKFHNRKTNLIFFICGALLILSGVVLAIVISILAGVLVALVGAFVVAYPFIMLASSMNVNKRMIHAEDQYLFDKNNLHISSMILGEEVANIDVKYENLAKIAMNNKYIFVYINKDSALILERKEIKEKDQKEIVTAISNAIEKKKEK